MLNNRITAAIAQVNTKLADITPEALASLEKATELDMGDWLMFGDKPSRAMLAGKVDAGEAQSLHMIHTAYNRDATTAEKVVFLQVMSEMLRDI